MRAMALAVWFVAACGDDAQTAVTPDAAGEADAAPTAVDAASATVLGDAAPCDPNQEDCNPYDPYDPY